MSTGYNGATWTASELLTDVYETCRMPEAGTIDYTPTRVLALATQAIHDWGGYVHATARDGRMVTSTLRDLNDDAVVVGDDEYALPPMAVADSIETVTWVDEQGRECRLQLLPIGMESIVASSTDTGTPTCYAMRAGTIKIYPIPDGRGSLRISYMRRHGQLVVGSDTASVVSVSDLVAGTSSRIELAAVPSAFVANAWVDLVTRYYPYRIKASYKIGAVSGNYLHLSTTPLATLTALDLVGETVVTYGKTPYVSLPLEMRAPLTQQIAMPILTALGDVELASVADRLADKGAARARELLSPRVKSDRKKIVNPYSLARSTSGRRARWIGGD